MAATRLENTIFKPKPSDLDSNEWIEIPLYDVAIYGAGTREPASLLLAGVAAVDVEGDVGRLTSKLKQSLLTKTTTFSHRIRIINVTIYAIGVDEDGGVMFWAGGQAGWYILKRPAENFKNLFENMCEAVRLWFFFEDLLQVEQGKQPRNEPVSKIFAKLYKDKVFNCVDITQARRIVLRHKTFLLSKIQEHTKNATMETSNKKGAGLKWNETALFKFLEGNDEDVLEDNNFQNNVNSVLISDDESITRAESLAVKGKSILRPRSTKFSTKSAGRRRSGAGESNGEMEDNQMDISPSLKRKDVLSSLGSMRKRSRTADSFDDEDANQFSSKAKGIIHDKVNIMASGSRQQHSEQKTTQPLVVKTQIKLEPQDTRGDIWSCDTDGCSHRVYKASSKKSKALIAEHHKKHDEDSQKQLDLVHREERPYLPVSNLLKKIRNTIERRY